MRRSAGRFKTGSACLPALCLLLLSGAGSPSIADSAAPADSLPHPITLEEAVALAQQNAPEAIQARGQVRTSAAAVRSAYAAFLPSVSLSAGGTRQLPARGSRTTIENGQVVTLPAEPWSFNEGLGANVTLFDGGGRFFDLKQAHAQASSAGANETAQSFAIALSTKRSFFDILAARESEDAAKAQLDQAEQQFRAAAARLLARTTTRSDSLRSDIQLRNARLAVIDARTSLDVANASLTRIVGTPYPVTAAETGLGDDRGISVGDGELLQLAENGPQVVEAKEALAAARAARKGAWTSYLPSLTAGYSRGGSGSRSDFSLSDEGFSYSGALRLSLSLPLFNQLQREEQVTRAQVAEENAAANLRDALLASRESLTTFLGAYRSASEHVDAQIATVAAAEEDLRVQQRRYAVGASTLLDLLTSQAQLDQARRDLIRARYDLRIAKAQLEGLVARDL